jgi:iron(III) transport system permease protein
LPIAYLLWRTLGAGGEVWDLLFRSRTLAILGRSVLLVAAVTAASTVIALPLAWLTTRTDLPLRRTLAILGALPLVIPSYVAGLVVIAALGPRGLLQQMLEGPFGIERLPEIYGFPGALLTITLISYPYVLLSLQGAMQGLDPSLEEASRSLGYGSWTTFRRVILPQLRPAIAAGALLVALYTLHDFGAVSLLRYETFTWAIYLQYQTSFDRMGAAALSLVLIVIAIGILFVEFRTRGRVRYHRSTLGTARPPSHTRLGRWRWPALAYVLLVVLLSLVMPMSVLGYWLGKGIAGTETFPGVLRATWNSSYVSLLAAGVTVLASLPITILAVRYRGRTTLLLEGATYLGFALPGIVIALSLVFFGANYVSILYQTVPLLLMAYAILALPQSVGSIRASLLQVSPRVEEAARNLGRSPLGVLWSVTLPLVRPGVLAGAALVFLTTMKELPATLLLSPIGFRTLATSIWSSSSEAFFARAALPALILIGVSLVPMFFVVTRERGEGREALSREPSQAEKSVIQ